MEDVLTFNTIQLLVIGVFTTIVILNIISLLKSIWGKDTECANCIKLHRTRSWYAIGILSFLIIILFAHKFYDYENVYNFMSFASAIISIILAVITIMYSYYTNSGTEEKVERLNKAAKKVEDATDNYSNSAESLKESVSEIKTIILEMDKKTDKILDSNSAKVKGKATDPTTATNFDIENYIKTYVDISSIWGLMAMYACVKSKETSKGFKINIFEDNYTEAYMVGFIIATASTGIITANVDFTNTEINVVNVIELAKNSIIDRLERDKDNEYVKTKKEIIDNFFKD